MAAGLVTLFLCGDVMLGRGVDQILPHPGDPQLRETCARDARAYVRLAERANCPVPRPASFTWPWGDALPVLDEMAPDARVINLETAVTRSAEFAPGKAIHYRMSPGNLPAVTAARPDACALANNHVLDFGPTGPRPPRGRASISCRACPALPPGTSLPGCRPSGNRVTSLSCLCTGAATGGMACLMTRFVSRTSSSTLGPISSTATPPTTPAPSRSTGADWSCMAAAMPSTTTRASAATSTSAAICACCTSPR